MKKMKHEKELLKKAIEIGQAYAISRGYNSFPANASMEQKVECIYLLLVQDKLVIPLPAEQTNGVNMKHRLVKWIAGKLPKEHPLLN